MKYIFCLALLLLLVTACSQTTIVEKACEKNPQGKDECIMGKATRLAKAEYCELISDNDYRLQCYARVAGSTGNTELCDKIADDTEKQECYAVIATRAHDPAKCSIITDQLLKQQCEMLTQSDKFYEKSIQDINS